MRVMMEVFVDDKVVARKYLRGQCSGMMFCQRAKAWKRIREAGKAWCESRFSVYRVMYTLQQASWYDQPKPEKRITSVGAIDQMVAPRRGTVRVRGRDQSAYPDDVSSSWVLGIMHVPKWRKKGKKWQSFRDGTHLGVEAEEKTKSKVSLPWEMMDEELMYGFQMPEFDSNQRELVEGSHFRLRNGNIERYWSPLEVELAKGGEQEDGVELPTLIWLAAKKASAFNKLAQPISGKEVTDMWEAWNNLMEEEFQVNPEDAMEQRLNVQWDERYENRLSRCDFEVDEEYEAYLESLTAKPTGRWEIVWSKWDREKEEKQLKDELTGTSSKPDIGGIFRRQEKCLARMLAIVNAIDSLDSYNAYRAKLLPLARKDAKWRKAWGQAKENDLQPPEGAPTLSREGWDELYRKLNVAYLRLAPGSAWNQLAKLQKKADKAGILQLAQDAKEALGDRYTAFRVQVVKAKMALTAEGKW